MLNPAVLKPLWNTQTCKWQGFGDKHLEAIATVAESVALKIFHRVAKQYALPAHAVSKLESQILDRSRNSRSEATIALQKICQKNSMMAMQTNNDAFPTKLRLSRQERFISAMKRYRTIVPPINLLTQAEAAAVSPALSAACNDWVIVDATRLDILFNEVHPNGTRSQNTEDDIHDILKAYYDV